MKLPEKRFKKGDIVRMKESRLNRNSWHRFGSFRVVSFSLLYNEGDEPNWRNTKEIHESKLDSIKEDIHVNNWIINVRSLENKRYYSYGEIHLEIDKRMTNLKELLDE